MKEIRRWLPSLLLLASCGYDFAQAPTPAAAAPSAQQEPAALRQRTPAQQPSPTPPSASPASTPAPVEASPELPNGESSSKGQVLFQSHGEPPEPGSESNLDPSRRLLPAPSRESAGVPELTDLERGALTFTAYDLDVRVDPAKSGLAVRARITVRNDGPVPLRRLALQVSSSLTWESVSLLGNAVPRRIELEQHTVDTDADHTGKASEAVLTLPAPLGPGRSAQLDAIYSGAIAPSAERLLRIGAAPAQARAADWDAIEKDGVWLRGFGNVLWYPAAAPQVFLGEGTQLFEAIGQTKLRQQTASVRLQLSVTYAGDPPAAAYFCGRRAEFTAVSDTPEAPISAGGGVAHAKFAPEPLGFRVPNLFVVPEPETLPAPSLALETPDATTDTATAAVGSTLAHAVSRAEPLLTQWLGVRPLSALTLIDHRGQAFEDGPLLVAPAADLEGSAAEPAMVFSLTHAWIQSGRPWVDEGLAQFFALVDTEQNHGRDAMVAQLGELLVPLVAAEGNAAGPAGDGPGVQANGEALPSATSEVFFRRKAAAVWAMLRELIGDRALQVSLQAWRMRAPAGTTPEEDALALEGLMEHDSGNDLHAFFADWVLHDRGLPDLTIANVDSRQLPDTEKGHAGGWLTAVTVRNAGSAMANVPVVLSSGSFSATARLVIPAFGTATARLQTESPPTEVQVNDGITPEERTSVHRREMKLR